MMIYQDDILYVDVDKLDYRLMLTIDHPKKIRVLLGTIHPTEFENTIETILYLPSETQETVRQYIKSIFKS